MRKLVAMIAAAAALVLAPVVTADIAAAKDKAKSAEAAPTKSTTSEGAASGEKGMGSGSATNQAWDDTYKSDKAQEEQLKAGGKAQ